MKYYFLEAGTVAFLKKTTEPWDLHLYLKKRVRHFQFFEDFVKF